MKTIKAIALILVLAILFSAGNLSVFATSSSGSCGENLEWSFDDSVGKLTISGSGEMQDFSGSSAPPWNSLRKNIKEIVISDEVSVIGDYAFGGCSSVTSITVPKSVKSIGDCAFISCSSLSELTFEDGVQSLGYAAFAYCSMLTEIIIPDSVTTVGTEAFSYSDSLTSVTIGGGLEYLYAGMFLNCPNLKSITVDSKNPYLSSDEAGVLFNKDKNVLLVYPIGKTETSYAIPDSVIDINTGAFNFCENLTNITLSENTETIGANAFYCCENLENFIMPEKVSSIGEYAFAGCVGLTEICLPDTLESMGFGAFYSCDSLAKIYIPDNVTSIDVETFGYCPALSDVYYGAGESDWLEIKIESDNDCLTDATIHFNHEHSHTETVIKEETCDEEGVKLYSCVCSHSYTENIPETGHEDAEWTYKSDSVFVKNCSVCKKDYESKTVEILLGKDIIDIARTETVALNASVTDDFNCNLKFESANENIALIDENGVITAVNIGETTVTVSIDNTDISAVCAVNVTPASFTTVWNVNGVETSYDFLEGETIVAPPAPKLENHLFVRWFPEVPDVMPSEDLYFAAVFDKVLKSDNFDVSVTYSPDCFDEEISLDVSEITENREPGGIYMVDGKTYKQVGIFNIKVVSESNEVIQPNEGHKVTIKIAIPKAYNDRTDFVLYHRFVDGGREQLSTSAGTITVADGYLIFEVSKFSEFELLVKSGNMSISKLPQKLNYSYKENINLEGIELKITNADDTVNYITDTSLMTVSGFDSSETGKQTVTVTCNGFSDTFEVNVSYNWWQWIIRILFLGFLWY